MVGIYSGRQKRFRDPFRVSETHGKGNRSYPYGYTMIHITKRAMGIPEKGLFRQRTGKYSGVYAYVPTSAQTREIGGAGTLLGSCSIIESDKVTSHVIR